MSDARVRSLERDWLAVGGSPPLKLRAAWWRVGRCSSCGGDDCGNPCMTTLAEIAARMSRSLGIAAADAARVLSSGFQNIGLSVQGATAALANLATVLNKNAIDRTLRGD